MNKGLRHYRRSPSFFQLFAWSIHATCSEYSCYSLRVFTLFTQSIHTIRSEYSHCLLGAFSMMLNASNVFLALDKVDAETPTH
jgi:hypothetical protein